MGFLSPEFFDGLVIAVTVIGLLLAARRIYSDFRRGPRWPETGQNDIQQEKE